MHTSASPEDVALRLANERYTRLTATGPTFEFFERTQAFLMSVLKLGCRSLALDDSVPADDDGLREHHRFLQRGYVDKVSRCSGRVKFSYDFDGKPFLR